MMKYDCRKSILEGTELIVFGETTGAGFSVEILSELGRGSSCLVYRGVLRQKIDGLIIKREVVVKELYPIGLGIVRNIEKSGGVGRLIVPDERRDDFSKAVKNFGKSQIEFNEYYKGSEAHICPQILVYGKANDTYYSIRDMLNVLPLSKIDRSFLDLNTVAGIMVAVCKAIKKFHVKEKLYLDIKPDNIFLCMNTDKIPHVFIFDFDTVMKLENLKKISNAFFPYSPGWAAPEQLPQKADGIPRDPSLIGFHTDIYSIGALFFWLITERKVLDSDIKSIASGDFDIKNESKLCRNVQREILILIGKLVKDMLEPDSVKRKETYRHYIAINEVQKDFGKLYGLTTEGDNFFSELQEKIKILEDEIDRLRNDIREIKCKNDNS